MHYTILCIVDKTRSSELGKYVLDFLLHTKFQQLFTTNNALRCRPLLFQIISSELGKELSLFGTNSTFLILISLQSEGVNLLYFKLGLFFK